MIWILRSFWPSSLLASVSDSYLILSRASEELETSSRRKISLFELKVDDQAHELSDLGLEGEGLHLITHPLKIKSFWFAVKKFTCSPVRPGLEGEGLH